MKEIKYLLFIALMMFAISSCHKLTLEPKGILDDAALLGNEAGVQMYLADAYMHLPIEDFTYYVDQGYTYGNNHWDAAKHWLMSIDGEAVGWPGNVDNAGGFGYWPYDKIREINYMLENLPNYKSNYAEDVYNSLLGEAHFLRAFYYFGMVKRYGGVPIIDSVLSPTADSASLAVSRSTELDCYKFIQSDLQFAMDNMAATSDLGRANKFVAAALMTRAMLYAGTIAKYGSYTTSTPGQPAAQKGYVGIPASEAQNFFTASYNAAAFFDAQNTGQYELVGENAADKEQSFVDMFLNDNSKESILIKQYSTASNLYNHSYDGSVSPSGDFSNWPGSEVYPALESVELFQTLPIENANGTPVRFDNRNQLWQGLEPRLLATVYFSGMTLRGSTFDLRRGFYRT
ncbi:MAG: RagB/SusD family nutrient uptake outer membrane protein, partial [Chitinophagaceae bacterium]|nr:RagB/SusD family nutrient uptake outer membrane protein [Chitinophagaceae bacterium]